MNLPTISIIIPTLNSAKTLGECLDSILLQDYPKDKLEIIIADGGSIDGTIDLIKSKLYAIRHTLYANPLRTGEAGKAVGVKKAKNEIIALIDSDNILPQKDWLLRMVEPFQNPEIIASEPISYTYRKNDSYITRYCALLGMNDPVCLWVGNYDRYCSITGKWTEISHIENDRGNYLEIEFPKAGILPTIGANGFFIRLKILKEYPIGDYLFDIDILYDLLSKERYKIAKVKTGIIHLYCKTTFQFIRKQKRRIRDYAYYNKLGLRKYPWSSVNKTKIIKFCAHTMFLAPLLIQSIKGFIKNKDTAWFFHPIACRLTLLVYGFAAIKNKIHANSMESRTNWQK